MKFSCVDFSNCSDFPPENGKYVYVIENYKLRRFDFRRMYRQTSDVSFLQPKRILIPFSLTNSFDLFYYISFLTFLSYNVPVSLMKTGDYPIN